jgi:hypothetical protein
MNTGMLRQQKLIMGIAALVVGVVLLIGTLGTQGSYADGDPTGRMVDGGSAPNSRDGRDSPH